MRLHEGPPVFKNEYWVPAEGCGFGGFVLVHVTLDRSGTLDVPDDDPIADVREARGIVEDRNWGVQPFFKLRN